MRIPSFLYFATLPENEERVLSDGIRAGSSGLVFLATSPERAAWFVLAASGAAGVVVVPVETRALVGDLRPFVESATVFTHDGDVPAAAVMDEVLPIGLVLSEHGDYDLVRAGPESADVGAAWAA